ncbi:MAG: methyltransferase domain-containing protein [Chloroflexi bacterium]|nr:methyltransferase domain-containing protein [Chloroflexota bacterium]
MLPLDRQNEYRNRYRALNPGWQPSGDVYERLVRDSISPQTRLLDLGGGRGGLIERIRFHVGLAAALDPDLDSLLDHRTPDVCRLCGLADLLPFSANSFDVVTASWLLEHLTAPEAVFNEIQRILKPGGLFIFLTPNALHPLLIANRLSKLAPALQRKLVPHLYARSEADTFPVQYKANTAKALQRLCNRVGFTLQLHLIPDPTYTAFNESLFRLSAWAEQLIPKSLKIHLVGVAAKRL